MPVCSGSQLRDQVVEAHNGDEASNAQAFEGSIDIAPQ